MGIHPKEIYARMSLILIGLIIGLVLLELFLRIYNPMSTRVTGNEIRLLTNYKRTINIQKKFHQKGLDEKIIYSTNSIGFRGEDPPVDFGKYVKIFTVGGSTTECSLLDDEKTWTSYLNRLISDRRDNTWVHNAGMDGASTFGHQILLREHLLEFKPDIILFLVGINEMWIADYGEELLLNKSREHKLRNVADHSELFSLLWNGYRSIFSKKLRAGHHSSKILDDLPEELYHERKRLLR